MLLAKLHAIIIVLYLIFLFDRLLGQADGDIHADENKDKQLTKL